MAKKDESTGNNQPKDFHQFMFGRPSNEAHSTTQKEDNSFDIFETTSTLVETYQQLSPYFEQITHLIKKRTKKK